MSDELEAELERMDVEFQKFERWYEWIKQKAKWTRDDWRKFIFGMVTMGFLIGGLQWLWNWYLLMVQLGLWPGVIP